MAKPVFLKGSAHVNLVYWIISIIIYQLIQMWSIESKESLLEPFFNPLCFCFSSGNMDYVCKESNKCVIDVSRRNQCQACRLKRCLEVKMNKDGKQLKLFLFAVLIEMRGQSTRRIHLGDCSSKQKLVLKRLNLYKRADYDRVF